MKPITLRFRNFLLLTIFAILGIAWSFMIPAWLSGGTWGATIIQFLVLCQITVLGATLMYTIFAPLISFAKSFIRFKPLLVPKTLEEQ